MCSLESLKIDLRGLSDGETVREYDLDDAYFEAIEAPEVKRGNLHVRLVVRKNPSFFELDFHTEGTVIVACDKCLDDMRQPICTDNRLMVKYGAEHSEEDDLVTLAETEDTLDVAWYVYEFVVLDIPIKHVHQPGECNPAMIHALKEHSATRSSDEDEGKPIDPRWEALGKIRLED